MELILPNNYVEIEEEEMMYLDGGAYLSRNACRAISAYFGSGYGLIAVAGSLAAARKLINAAGRISGFLGTVVSWTLSYIGYRVADIMWYIGTATIRNRAVNIGWSWSPWSFGPSCSFA